MNSSVTMPDRRALLLALLLPALAACGDDAPKPYFEFAGGGFVFNYRTANHFYGFVVRQKTPLPDGARIRVTFETPQGEQVQNIDAVPGRLQYKFQTGDLDGIVAGHPYKAVLVVLDGATEKELGRLEKTFKTEADQSKLPDKPLVVGPGYEQPAE